MSTIALILFVAVVLSTRWYFAHHRSLVVAAAAARGVHFAPNHTWLRIEPDGLVTVGASDLAANFSGRLAAVQLPARGTRSRRLGSGWTFTSDRGRVFSQALPVGGEVVAVNEEVFRDPGLVQRSPFENGWLVRLRPEKLERALHRVMYGSEARAWMESVRDRIMAVVSPEVGVVGQDGGEWRQGFGDALDDEMWEKLSLEFFPKPEPGETFEPRW